MASGAVAAGTPEATAVGIDILSRGGNAADAAVAISLALSVTEAARSGLGGQIVLLMSVPGERPTVLYAPTTRLGQSYAPQEEAAGGADSPAGGRAPDSPAGGGAPGGPAAVVPALLPVLHALLEEHGSGLLTWEELVRPAVELAREGHVLGRLTHRTIIQEYSRLLARPEAASLVLTENRAIPAEGTRVRHPALAATLQVLAREGPGALYSGELGRRLMEGARNAGIVLEETAELQAPAVRRIEALRGTFLDHEVWVPPEPFAGRRLLEGLQLLESAPPDVWTSGESFRMQWLAEAVALSMSDASGGLPDFLEGRPPLPVPATDTAYPTSPRASTTAPEPPTPDTVIPVLNSQDHEETTHFSVADGQGMVISATQSLGRPFGSAVPAGDLGFFLGSPEGPSPIRMPGARRPTVVTPDAPSGEGSEEGGRAGSAGANEEVLKWAVPTLVQADERILVLGSPGGPRGLSAVLQVTARWVHEPGALARVVRARRLHLGPDRSGRGRLYLEGMVSDPTSHTLVEAPPPWSDTLRSALAARGFLPSERDVGLLFDGLSPWFGGVNAVFRFDGDWGAVADPRRDGQAGVPGGGLPGLNPPGDEGGSLRPGRGG